LWARDPDTAASVAEQHVNERCLPGLALPPTLEGTADPHRAVLGADVVVAAVPAQSLRAVLRENAPTIRPWVPFVSLAKGLERRSHKTMTEVVAEELPGHPAGALSGPNIATEVAHGMATAATLAMPDEALARWPARASRWVAGWKPLPAWPGWAT
jgi:glycerol-3-phosphate dehydrogenase (NAD(P)+)